MFTPITSKAEISEYAAKAVFSLIILYFVYNIAYAYLLSPVRHVPGPFWSKVTSIPLHVATFRAARAAYAHKLIQAYGPIVVIAPDQVHTTDDVAMKIIYNKHAVKTQFYHGMGLYKGVRHILGTIDYASASLQRNNLLQCFQSKNLSNLSDAMESHIADFIALLNKRAALPEPAVEGVLLFRLLTLDTVSDVLWGEEHGLLTHDDSQHSELLRRFHHYSKYMALRGFIPFFESWTRLFGTKRYKNMRADCYDLDVYAKLALDKWTTGKTKHHDRDVLSMLMTMNEKLPQKIDPQHIPAYMVEMMAAGSSTTSNTAVIACWVLARHEYIQRQLREELFQTFPDHTKVDMKLCLNLKFLECIIYEVMRLWPIVPGPLQRYLSEPISVTGVTVPAGVIASTSAYDQGQREDVFPNPGRFDPSRWTNATDEMKKNWTPFGHGSRSCPGQNLGMTELKYFLAAIFRQFKSVLPPNRGSDMLEMRDVFTASISIRNAETGKSDSSCWLQFAPSPGEI